MLRRKMISFLLFISVIFCFVSCGGKGQVVCALLESTETRVVFRVNDTDGKATALDCMDYLSENTDGFSYKISGGMVTEINGKANAADFSGCWMLYTSDADMSNAEWGTLEYGEQTLGSAIIGAETLVVQTGEIYAWEYVIF